MTRRPATDWPSSWPGLASNAYGLGDETPSARWHVPAPGPISAYAFADITDQPGKELVLGRLDGFMHIVDGNGKMVHSWANTGSGQGHLCVEHGQSSCRRRGERLRAPLRSRRTRNRSYIH